MGDAFGDRGRPSFCTVYKISYGSVKIFANPLENALINR